MRKSKFSLAHIDGEIAALVKQTDHHLTAIWAKACAERVLHYFEETLPGDSRPHQALETLQAWIDTGHFQMAVIRSASLAAHAAAREVGEDNPARSAARSAGQAACKCTRCCPCHCSRKLRPAGHPQSRRRSTCRFSGCQGERLAISTAIDTESRGFKGVMLFCFR